MSLRVTSYIWQHPDRYPVGGGALLVLLAIADNADDGGGNAWPSLSTLARKARLSERQVVNVVRQLEAAGLVAVERGGGRGNANRYTIAIAPPMGEAQFTETISVKAEGNPEICDTERVKSATERVKSATERVKPTSPERSYRTVQKERDDERPVVARARARAATAMRLPPDFAVSPEMRAWAAERAPAVDLDIEHERFCNYWWGSGKTKRDWPATWRTWMLGEQSRANQRRPAGRASPSGNGHRATTSERNWALYEAIRRQEEGDDATDGVPGAIDAAFRSHE